MKTTTVTWSYKAQIAFDVENGFSNPWFQGCDVIDILRLFCVVDKLSAH